MRNKVANKWDVEILKVQYETKKDEEHVGPEILYLMDTFQSTTFLKSNHRIH